MIESKTSDIHEMIQMSEKRREQLWGVNERFFDIYECNDAKCDYAELKQKGGHKE